MWSSAHRRRSDNFFHGELSQSASRLQNPSASRTRLHVALIQGLQMLSLGVMASDDARISGASARRTQC